MFLILGFSLGLTQICVLKLLANLLTTKDIFLYRNIGLAISVSVMDVQQWLLAYDVSTYRIVLEVYIVMLHARIKPAIYFI
jgi:hypothetical protein